MKPMTIRFAWLAGMVGITGLAPLFTTPTPTLLTMTIFFVLFLISWWLLFVKGGFDGKVKKK